MLRVRFEVDSAVARLNTLSAVADNPEAAAGSAALVVSRAIQRNFDEEGRPVPWPPLSIPYALWKARRYPGRKILERTLALRSSIRVDVEPDLFGTASIAASTDIPYAPFHQFGAPGRNLPPRPFLVLTEEDKEEVAQAVADTLEEF